MCNGNCYGEKEAKKCKTWNVLLLALNKEMGDKYELGYYAFQGERLMLPDGTEMDCDDSGYTLYFTDGTVEHHQIMQNENGIVIEDRIKSLLYNV